MLKKGFDRRPGFHLPETMPIPQNPFKRSAEIDLDLHLSFFQREDHYFLKIAYNFSKIFLNSYGGFVKKEYWKMVLSPSGSMTADDHFFAASDGCLVLLKKA